MLSILIKARKNIFGMVLAALGVGSAFAENAPPAVRAGVEKLLPGIPIDSIRETPMAGLYEVVIGPRLIYMSGDGRFLVQGSLYDIDKQEDLTESSRGHARMSALANVAEDRMVIFSPDNPKYTVTVFTDIDCGYCRKLHSEMEGYNSRGIRVRYLFYPRAGIQSPSYNKAVSVWCATDRNQALTDAKNGKPVETKQCENPVSEHYLLGELMGVTGTPAIFLEDGEMLPGYIPAPRLGAYLEGKQGQTQKTAQNVPTK
jgi:thiol:disulfide interchange protein DsbC